MRFLFGGHVKYMFCTQVKGRMSRKNLEKTSI
jgi:hypothetical protein